MSLSKLLLRTAHAFSIGDHECFEKDYEHLFDVPQQLRTDNDVSGLSPIHSGRRSIMLWAIVAAGIFIDSKNNV